MAKYDVVFDYFHGYESEQFAFYRIPKVLFTDDYFRDLSSDAKVLYGLMLDRMSLSIKNNWIDDEDRVYIIFTLEQVMQYMNCGKDKGVKILAELDTDKGIGLIERVKRGLGKPAIIYVKSFLIKEKSMLSEIGKAEQQPENMNRSPAFGEGEVQTSEKPKSGVLEKRSQEFGKIEVRTSEKEESGVLKNRSAEFGKNASNYTNINYNDQKNNNLINQSEYQSGSSGERIDEMDAIFAYTDLVKTNIEYDTLIHDCRKGDRVYIDEMVDLLVETISINRKTIMIAGAEYPYQFVKGKLLKINHSHVQYVLECLHGNTID